MPRGKPRKTMQGQPAQKVRSVPGQRYGEGKQSNELQRQMPAPDVQAASPVGGGPTSPMPPNVPAAPQPPAADPAAIQEFLASTNPNMLSGTQMPDQPVTAGLSSGPGPGPSALARPTTPTARYARRLSQDTGNPKWARLAERAGLV